MTDQVAPAQERLPYGISDFDPQLVEKLHARDPEVVGDDGMANPLRGPLIAQKLPWLDGVKRLGTAPVGDPAIRIHGSPTFIYVDAINNYIEPWSFIQMAINGELQKAEHHRLGYENSEDALTANVLLSLCEVNALAALVEYITGDKPASEPKLFLWGIPVGEPDSQWSELQRAREFFERSLLEQEFQTTEPDAALYVPGHMLILIEAKFGSPNPGLETKHRKKFLERYNANRVMSSSRLVRAPVDETPEQLLRNIAFADHMASDEEKPFVFNLVRDGDAMDIKQSVCSRLHPDCRVVFGRITWEMIYADVIDGQPPLKRLQQYLLNKTYGLRPAFKLTTKSPSTS